MRIIAGEFRHRKLYTPKDASITRPIPDRVKESLFSLLRGWTEGASVLDVFAGTGAIGLEAVSRGAARCVFIERDKRIVELLRRNVEELRCDERCEVVQGDALGASLLSRCPRPVNLIFFDPPYPLIREPSDWARMKLQFSRVVALLSDQGYATLRTPWPFMHPVVGADQEAASEAPPDDAGDLGSGQEDDEGSPSGRRGSRRPDRRDDKKGRSGRSSRENDADGGRGKGDRRDAMRDDDGEIIDQMWEGDDLEELLAEGFEDEGTDGEEQFADEEGIDGKHDDAGDDDADEQPDGIRRTEMVDLAIPGAIGPETHIYGNTAIHLYMRDKNAVATPTP